MKKCRGKIYSFLLVIAMIVSIIPNNPVSYASEKKSVTIMFDSITVTAGSEFTVDISVKDNPGILGAGLKIDFDSKLTLKKVESGDAFSSLVMTKPGKLQSPYQVVWDGVELSADDITDGAILQMTFSVSDSVKAGEVFKFEVSSEKGEFVDTNLNPLDVEVIGGEIRATNYTPGDVNEDGKINSTDVILVRRDIAGGYETKISEQAADVNNDGRINSTDVILIRRYIAGGYDVVLKPSGDNENHNHSLTHIEAKDATCTDNGNIEYWHCQSCDKYYSDSQGLNNISSDDTVIKAKGHTSVTDPAVAPTYTETGLTEGAHCSECKTILVKQNEIPKLNSEEYAITYHLYNGDVYLQKADIKNPNPDTYNSETGMILDKLECDGYIFEGWYDGEGEKANLVTGIAKGEKRNLDLYARWTAREYTITFDSPLVKVDSIKYKVSEGASLTNPEWFGYTFMGWTDEDDKLVKSIPKGTVGNMTLHANWTSKRNQTRPVKELGEPIIIENDKEGQYLFAYEIGQIENVPLYTMKDFGNTSGLTISETITSSGTISEGTADSIVNTIANTTTRTMGWTLSKNWNDSMTMIRSHTDESGKEVIDSTTNVNSDSTVTLNSTNSNFNYNNSTTNTNGVSAKVGLEVGAEYSTKVSAGIGLDGIGNIGAESGLKVYGKVSGEVQSSHEDSNTEGISATWGGEDSTEHSNSSSTSRTSSTALSSKVSDTYGYNKTHSEGGSEALTSTESRSDSESKQYSSALTYSTQKTDTTSKTYSNADAPEGYYRLVCAGTIHMFAVVGFDIASGSYYVYTYGVQDDETYDFIDYSKQTHSFDDNENGILPFEVPYYPNQYVNNALAKTKGLVYDSETGTVVDYVGKAKDVRIPDYISTDNGDGTTSVVKIVGVEKTAFSGNTDITSVKLSKHIKEIPEHAFEGCTSLEKVTGGSIETIGNSAFSGCTHLENFTVSKDVKSLGKKAFEDVGKVTVNAKNSQVVDSAIASGAKQLVVNLADLEDKLADKTYNIKASTQYFEINGGNNTYKGIKIVSDAKKTVINGFVFENSKSAPIVCSSDDLTLSRVTANADNFALILSADTTNISLYGTIKLTSSGSNAVLCKNIALSRLNTNIVGKLQLAGNMMICGKVDGDDLLSFKSGEKITISEESYNNLLNGSIEWVLASDMPEGATVVGEKWTYDYTTKITSSNNSVDGYTLYDTTWVWGNYGSWSGYSTSAVSGSDSRQVETRTIPAQTKTQYNYSRWTSNSNNTGKLGPVKGTWGGVYCQYYFERGWSDSALAVSSTQYSKQVGGYFNLYGNDQWFNQTTRTVVTRNAYTEYRYRDRSKIYTYHLKKVENKESSTEVAATDSISNVKKWVQYVIK